MSRLAKTNKNVMTAVFTAQVIVLLGYIVQMAVSDSGKTVADLLTAFGAPAVCDMIALTLYFGDRETLKVRNLCFASFILFMAVSLFLNHNPLMYVIGFPIIIAFGYYNDYTFTLMGCITLMAINIIAVVIYAVTIPGYLTEDSSRTLYQVITHVFLVFTLPASVKFINKDHADNIAREQKRADETAALLEKSNRSADFIKEVISNTGQAVDRLTRQSHDMSDSAEKLRRDAEVGKEKAEEAAAVVFELKNRIISDARDAEASITLAQTARGQVQRSNAQIEEAIGSVNNIKSVTGEIDRINKTIDSIAFQTNILALNASVEAARAGAHGKGFAVVAEEVRALAGKSAEASTETNTLLEHVLEAVNKGGEDINAAAKEILTISESSQRLLGLAERIAASTIEQQGLMDGLYGDIENIRLLISGAADSAHQNFELSNMVKDEAASLTGLVLNEHNDESNINFPL